MGSQIHVQHREISMESMIYINESKLLTEIICCCYTDTIWVNVWEGIRPFLFKHSQQYSSPEIMAKRDTHSYMGEHRLAVQSAVWFIGAQMNQSISEQTLRGYYDIHLWETKLRKTPLGKVV